MKGTVNGENAVVHVTENAEEVVIEIATVTEIGTEVEGGTEAEEVLEKEGSYS